MIKMLIFLLFSNFGEYHNSLACYCDDCEDNICYTEYFCFGSIRFLPEDSKFHQRRTCLYSDDAYSITKLFCISDNKTNFINCCFYNNCNSHENMSFFQIIPTDSYNKIINQINYKLYKKFILIGILLFGILLVLILIIFLVTILLVRCKIIKIKNSYIFKCYKILRRLRKIKKKNFNINDRHNEEKNVCNNDYILSNESKIISSQLESSGAGIPLLYQAKINNQIILQGSIDKGRFGNVNKALFKGKMVAVKRVVEIEKEFAYHEAAIYHNYHLRHENILCFITIDNCYQTVPFEVWLIFDFHSNGSLVDYLSNPDFHINKNIYSLKMLLLSLSSGLSYLHQQIDGINFIKPRIAHRDLKSKNILIKSDHQCCIADLGLSVVERTFKEDLDIPENADNFIKPSKSISFNHNVGTRRYMSPEILEAQIMKKKLNFNDFLKSDIYSFSLILWEILNSYNINNDKNTSKLNKYHVYPYENSLPNDPDTITVYNTIVTENKRPMLIQSESGIDNEISRIIKLCWHHDPNTRPSILYVYQKLENLFNE